MGVESGEAGLLLGDSVGGLVGQEATHGSPEVGVVAEELPGGVEAGLARGKRGRRSYNWSGGRFSPNGRPRPRPAFLRESVNVLGKNLIMLLGLWWRAVLALKGLSIYYDNGTRILLKVGG